MCNRLTIKCGKSEIFGEACFQTVHIGVVTTLLPSSVYQVSYKLANPTFRFEGNVGQLVGTVEFCIIIYMESVMETQLVPESSATFN